MTIDYLVADPSGNTTILVLTPVAKAQHSSLAAQLLALPGIEAEQVGYVSREAGKPLRVDMMGGEFCGNASRSAAAWPAYGLVLCDTKKGEMIPAVYVRDTDTLYWENSCGSGSAAVAAALACTTYKNVACYMKQPGGTLAIAAKVSEKGDLQQIFIGGPVRLGKVRSVNIQP